MARNQPRVVTKRYHFGKRWAIQQDPSGLDVVLTNGGLDVVLTNVGGQTESDRKLNVICQECIH